MFFLNYNYSHLSFYIEVDGDCECCGDDWECFGDDWECFGDDWECFGDDCEFVLSIFVGSIWVYDDLREI